MAQTNFGKGIAAQGQFRAADAMWVNDRNRRDNLEYAKQQAKDKEKAKTEDYINNYILVNSKNVHPLFQEPARKATADFLLDMATSENDNYLRTQSGATKLKELSDKLASYNLSSKNINEREKRKAMHPGLIESDPTLDLVINEGDYNGFLEYKNKKGEQGDNFSMAEGLLPVPDMSKEFALLKENGYNGGKITTGKPTPIGSGIVMTDIFAEPNEAYRDQLAASLWTRPDVQNYFSNKGGIDELKNRLTLPIKQVKRPSNDPDSWNKTVNINRNGVGGGSGSLNELWNVTNHKNVTTGLSWGANKTPLPFEDLYNISTVATAINPVETWPSSTIYDITTGEKVKESTVRGRTSTVARLSQTIPGVPLVSNKYYHYVQGEPIKTKITDRNYETIANGDMSKIGTEIEHTPIYAMPYDDVAVQLKSVTSGKGGSMNGFSINLPNATTGKAINVTAPAKSAALKKGNTFTLPKGVKL